MLQISFIKDQTDVVISGLKKRGFPNIDQTIERVLQLDQQRRETQTQLDHALASANAIAREIGQLMREDKKEAAEAAKQKTSDLKATNKIQAEQLKQYEEELKNLLYNIPNIPHANVPEGKNADDNEIIFQVNILPELPATTVPHWDLIKRYDIIDFDLGNKISGAGLPVYKGKGARMQRAMINFFLDEALKAGYLEIQPPILVNEESGYATGQLPDKEGQMYHISDSNLYLIPTAEVPITNLYRDTILKQEDLPIKNVGYTPCFRREAGSWGAHARGLNRLHQFDKVELVQIQHPEKSYKTLEEMTAHVRQLLEKLDLPFRVLRLCGGDMGFTSAMTYDLEVYAAAQQKWLEVSSVSNFETYQANRLKLRYKNDQNKTELLHTLNGSALALPRILAAILENNQTPEGIKVPEVLVPYTGFDVID